MPNLENKFYYRYTCIGKNIVYTGSSTIHGFQYPVWVLECILHKRKLLITTATSFLIYGNVNNWAVSFLNYYNML